MENWKQKKKRESEERNKENKNESGIECKKGKPVPGAILKTKWKFKILIKRRKESEERLESESVMCNESQCRGLFLLHHLWEITKPLGIQGNVKVHLW